MAALPDKYLTSIDLYEKYYIIQANLPIESTINTLLNTLLNSLLGA